MYVLATEIERCCHSVWEALGETAARRQRQRRPRR